MSRRIHILVLALGLLCGSVLFGQERDDFCLWLALDMSEQMSDEWQIGMRAEKRRENNLKDVDQAFFRFYGRYTKWKHVRLAMNMDIVERPGAYSFRVLPEASLQWKEGYWGVTVRQRYMGIWKPAEDSWSQYLRTRLFVSYRKDGASFSPHFGAEPFYWDGLYKCRLTGGVSYYLMDWMSFSLNYVREQYRIGPSNNVLTLSANIRL